MADTVLYPNDLDVASKMAYAQQNFAYADAPKQGALSFKPGSWNWCSHAWSAFAMVCCCWCACFSSLFGLIGLICSTSAYTDYKSGDYDGAKYKKGCAVAWTLAGIVLGLGTLAVIAYFGYMQGPALYSKAMEFVNSQVSSILEPYLSQLNNIPQG